MHQLRRELAAATHAATAAAAADVEGLPPQIAGEFQSLKTFQGARAKSGLADLRPPPAKGLRLYREKPSPGAPASGNGASEPLKAGERKILTVLAQYPEGRTKRQLAILTGYAPGGGGFNNHLGALRSKGLMAGEGDGPMQINEAALAALGDHEPLPRGRALLEHWLGQLDKAPRLILAHLASSWPDHVGKRELAEAVGYESSGGAFNNALGKLRTLQLINGSQRLRAADELLEGG